VLAVRWRDTLPDRLLKVGARGVVLRVEALLLIVPLIHIET
jgi:hypothetical protein